MTLGAQATPSNPRNDMILPATRIVAVVIFPVLILGFILLYLMPTETESHFAWTINPEMTPLIMGSGYLAGTYYFIRIAFGRRWSHVALTNPAVSMFAAMMMVATVLHWDLFNHNHWAFFTWVSLYTLAPPLVLAIWWWNRKLDPGMDGYAGPIVPDWARLGLALSGLIATTLGVVTLVHPQFGIDIWPWTLSPLTARVIAGWLLLSGTASLVLAPDRRWDVWRMPFETTVFWSILVLAGVVRAWDNFEPGAVATWVFVGAVGSVVIGYAVAYAAMESKRERVANRSA